MKSITKRFEVAVLLLSAACLTVSANAAELRNETRLAFARYVQLAESRMQSGLPATGKPFLWIDTLSKVQHDAILDRLRKGEVVTEKLEEREQGLEIKIPGGMVHHWIGNVFVPGATLQQTLQLLQDYDHHKDLYKPEVVDSRLLRHDGNIFKAYLRFYKKKIIGVTLNTEHTAEYVTVNPRQAYSNSHTTRIAEVDNAGEANEKEKPVGNDSGFLWALNSYWRIEEKDNGVYIQCEAISLTRDIPGMVSWIVKPFITEVPKESIYTTLNSTRVGLQRFVRSNY